MFVRRFGGASLLALIGVLVVPHLAVAAELSAQVTMTRTGRDGRKVTVTGTIYAKGRNLRMEAVQGRNKRIRIINADKKMLWLIDSATKTYTSAPATAEMVSDNMYQLRGQLPPEASKEAKVKRLGTEAVNGYPCEKTQTQTKEFTMTTWYSKKLDMALKLDTKMTQGGQFHQEATNIKVGPQPASLFTVPKGYKEVKAPAMTGGPGGPGGRGGTMRRPPGRR